MNRSHQYAEIKTIDQLRIERLRIRDRIEASKDYIESDIEDIAGMFTLEGIVNMIFPHSGRTDSVLGIAYSAYDLVSSVLGVICSRRKKC